jgi:hypothetical protein
MNAGNRREATRRPELTATAYGVGFSVSRFARTGGEEAQP